MKAGHTPGTWTVDRNMIETKDGQVIAQVSYEQDGYVRANAALMAAAPELLDALKIMLEVAMNDITEECDIARAAIARAEGRC
jgi:uncharacterized membrane-anchored protein